MFDKAWGALETALTGSNSQIPRKLEDAFTNTTRTTRGMIETFVEGMETNNDKSLQWVYDAKSKLQASTNASLGEWARLWEKPNLEIDATPSASAQPDMSIPDKYPELDKMSDTCSESGTEIHEGEENDGEDGDEKDKDKDRDGDGSEGRDDGSEDTGAGKGDTEEHETEENEAEESGDENETEENESEVNGDEEIETAEISHGSQEEVVDNASSD